MEQAAGGQQKKLFKYYLDQTIKERDNRPLFFRRTMRWRVNSQEYGYPFSKKGILRGYIKYGVFAYIAWYYVRQAFTPAHHGHHGHGHNEHAHSEARHGTQPHEAKH